MKILTYARVAARDFGKQYVHAMRRRLMASCVHFATTMTTVAAAGLASRGFSQQGQVSALHDDASLRRRVFIIHGRDNALAAAFRMFLRSAGLEPLEWEILVEGTSTAAPYLGQVVANAPHLAQAILALLSPDDVVKLHSDLFQDNDHPYERDRTGQARPNVLFELGMALMAYPERTVVVEVGQMRPIADLAGLNVIRFDGSAVAKRKVLSRLELAGCLVDDSGTDWLDAGRFSGLDSYRRGPNTDSSPGTGDDSYRACRKERILTRSIWLMSTGRITTRKSWQMSRNRE